MFNWKLNFKEIKVEWMQNIAFQSDMEAEKRIKEFYRYFYENKIDVAWIFFTNPISDSYTFRSLFLILPFLSTSSVDNLFSKISVEMEHEGESVAGKVMDLQLGKH